MTESAELVSVGLASLCGVANTDFNDKHWGAALIAAGLMTRAERASPAACSAITVQAERLVKNKASWLRSPIRSGAGDVADVVEALVKTAASLNLLGHDTIFATLALRAMSDQPELATSANVEAVVNMVEFAEARGPGGPFPGWEDPAAVIVEEHDGIPPIETTNELAVSAATVFAGVGTVYDGLDRGVVQHILTHAHALIELRTLGYTEAASSGIEAHRIYRKLMTRRPSEGEHPLPTDAVVPDFRSERYWQQDLRGRDDWLYGHVFKVAFAWTALETLLPAAVHRRARPMLATSMVVT